MELLTGGRDASEYLEEESGVGDFIDRVGEKLEEDETYTTPFKYLLG